MASTLWRNAVIDTRSLRSVRRERLTQHNTQLTRLFRALRLERNSVNPGRNWAVPRWSAGVPPTLYSSAIGNQMPQNSGLMQGKRGVILGVANNRSIAWGIARACRAAGAEIALTWQGDALKKRVEPLAKELDGILIGHCDVTEPSTIDAAFEVLREKWGKIDFVVHAIAFSDKDQLDGRYLETTADNFSRTMLISCYSLTAIAQRAEKLLV